MFALIRFSDKFYLLFPKHFLLFRLYAPGYKPPPRLLAHPKPLMKLDKPRALEWDFTVFGRPYNRTEKKCFKTSYIAVLIKILLEFDRFFKLQNVVKGRIHFNTI